jgi:pilus assembly protein FimV
LISKSHRWQKTAIAAAAIALLGFTSTGASALSLGRLTVLSALGEPLRAEIDVPEINAEEAASLRASVASPATFVAAGLDYNPAMSGLQTSLQRRADGRAYIRLTSDRSINDPFVDMILEATWSSGRIVRDYTMLFDPPVLKQAAAPTQAQVPAQQAVPVPAKVAPAPSAATSSESPRSTSAPKPARVAPAASTAAPAPKAVAEGGQQITVKNGDTASKIAARGVTSGVSLDQMLVAMMRSNPDAFVNNNLNRLRTGSVINMPSAEQAQSVAPKEASQMVVAQSKDFNDFRRNLASNAPKADVAPADRATSGKVDAKVEDKKPTAATPDKLTLSKGSVQSKADEAKVAKERAEKDAAARATEIAKNISDLNKLSAASAPKTAPAVTVAPAPAVAVSKPAAAPAVTVAAAPPVTAPASAPAVVASAPAPAAVASAPAPAASAVAKPKPAPALPVPAEPAGLLDELLEDPMVPAAAGGLVALLGGLGFYFMRKRKQSSARVDSSFLESRLQPDSFFGASGGQRIDTNDSPGNPSSMVYSTSQLDAADDVDPVAEADVYLAYGRDLQAEEILKEAVRHSPGRLAIHTKLLEIFAKRRDASNFQSSAQQALSLTGVDSPEWARICEMGLAFDPENRLYQPGGATASAFAPAADAGQTVPGSVFGSTVVQSTNAELPPSAASGVDLDLDLDFSIDDEPGSAISDMTGARVPAREQTVKMEAAGDDGHMTLDFDISSPAELDASPGMQEYMKSNSGHVPLAESSEPLPSFEPTGTLPVEAAAPTETVRDNSGMLEFDLGSLSLDLDPPTASAADAPDSTSSFAGDDPLETKLALAEEFISIGDEDGARALLEEVVADSSGDMRAKAQRVLANLS